MRKIISNKVIVIVGASQGIGREIALQLSKNNNHFYLISRNEEKLVQLKSEIEMNKSRANYFLSDATQMELSNEIANQIIKSHPQIDYLFLVAGGSPPTRIAKSSAERINKIMATNFHTMVNYFMPFMHKMKENKHGHIVHINSLAAFAIFPDLGPYAASKAAAKVFLDTARAELDKSNVFITSIHPGFIQTEGLGNQHPPYLPVMKVDKAVSRMIRAVENRKRKLIFPIYLYLLVRITHFIPYAIMRFLYKRL